MARQPAPTSPAPLEGALQPHLVVYKRFMEMAPTELEGLVAIGVFVDAELKAAQGNPVRLSPQKYNERLNGFFDVGGGAA
jgi:hypothetical protein